jgi:hypothetical protein
MQEEISDPTGFEAVLTDACWPHITEHHPEMSELKHLVAEAVRNPDGIYLGRRDPTRRIYRKRYESVPGVGNWLDVLVFVGKESGYVATSYFAAYSLRTLGQQIWPSS